jgi:hypothetical protein
MVRHRLSVLAASFLLASSAAFAHAGEWSYPEGLTSDTASPHGVMPVAQLDPPQLVSPADGDTNQTTWGIFVWRPTPGATRYHLRMSADSLFSVLMIDDSTLTDTSAAYRAYSSTRYFWKVRAVDGLSSSEYSPVWSFKTWDRILYGYPSLIAPPNASSHLTDTVVIRWHRYQRGEQYHLIVLASDDPAVNESALADTCYRCPVKPGLRYVWHVRSKLSTVWSRWSDDRWFLTRVKAPLLIAPAKDTVGISREVIFRWHSVPGALSYYARVSEDSLHRLSTPGFGAGHPDTVISGIIPASQTHVYWSVVARGVGGTDNESAVWHFTTAQSIPVLALPLDGDSNQSTSPVLSWRLVSGASAYQVQAAPPMQWDSAHILMDTTVSDTSVMLHGLQYSTDYAWRVRSTGPEGASAYSPARWFHTRKEEAAAPELLFPVDGAQLSMAPVTFIWRRSMPLATRYGFEVSPDSTFLVATMDTTLTDTSLTVTGLTIGRHWWRVRAGTPDSWGAFRPAFRFTAGFTSVNGPAAIPAVHSLDQNYPNPFNPATVIRFGLPEASEVRLAIYNILGQEIRVLARMHAEAGYHTVRFDGTGLPTGVYFYRLQAGRFVAARTLTIVR